MRREVLFEAVRTEAGDLALLLLERKMTPPVFRFPGYEERHSLVTEIITRRGYKIKGRP